jgi:hypothetical protein
MPRIWLDTIQDSSYQSDTNGIRIERGFVTDSLDVSIPFDIMRAAIATSPGMPQKGESHPTETTTRVTGYRMKFATTESVVRGAIIYQTPQQPGGGSSPKGAWTIQDTGALQSISASRIPGPTGFPGQNGINLKTTYTNNADPNAVALTEAASIGYLRPNRIISISTVLAQRPPITWSQAAGLVNQDTLFGLAPGYWLLFPPDVQTQDAGATYSIKVQWHSKCTEDWSSYDASTLSINGKPVPGLDAEFTRLSALPYQAGPSQMVGNGLTRVFPYNWTGMRALFGIPPAFG